MGQNEFLSYLAWLSLDSDYCRGCMSLYMLTEHGQRRKPTVFLHVSFCNHIMTSWPLEESEIF